MQFVKIFDNMDQFVNKPALILNYDGIYSASMGRMVRGLAGLDTKWARSVEAWERTFGGQDNNPRTIQEIANEIKRYSAIIIDNNFQADDHPDWRDGDLRGLTYIMSRFGDALLSIPREIRPLVICFAPSSEADLRLHQKELWDKLGILSLNQMNERAAIGLSIAIAQRYRMVLNRESIITKILQFPLGEDGKKDSTMVQIRDKVEQLFKGEDIFKDVEGKGLKQASFENTIRLFASHLEIEPRELMLRIESEVGRRRAGKEGIRANR